MPNTTPVSHSYFLGRDASFAFSGGIENKDVKTVNVQREASAEVDVTTRGSGNQQEFALARTNTTIEVTCLDHACVQGATGTITMSLDPAGGPTAPSGTFMVMSIGQSEDLEGAVEFNISLKKTPS